MVSLVDSSVSFATMANALLGAVLVVSGVVFVATRAAARIRATTKTTTTTTPATAVAGEKAEAGRAPAAAGAGAGPALGEHASQFPPSRRQILAGMPQFEKIFKGPDPTTEMLRNRALPTATHADLSVDNQYTPTGYSTQEIRALGRFPDYALLSGVPHPQPVGPKFDISKASFRPFRPFRWAYHQHMAIMKFEPDYWVELEQSYFSMMQQRQALRKKHGERLFFHGPGSELACRELMEMVFQFVCRRYAQYFSLEEGDTVFVNRLLGTRTDLTATHALSALFDNIPEDYAIMLRDARDGLYYCRAGMVCSSVGWEIGQHRDSFMHSIHAHVPDAVRMTMSIDRFFSKMPADRAVQRGSWGLEDRDVLFASPRADPENSQRSAFADCPDALTAGDLRLRCDWQTLRRLPLSGAIIFNFKAVFTPLADLRPEPFVPALLLRVLEAGREDLITYKCESHVHRVAMQTLREWAREQVDAGVVPADWEVATLDESPFYPGWEERWRAKQGF